MKKIIVTLMLLVLVAPAFSQQLAMNTRPVFALAPEKAAFNWTKTVYDFGKIKVGVPVTYEFAFTNAGEVPLIISTVQASCGCTVTEYTKDPIEPGAEGYVKATYNAAHVGQFTKTVTVNANTADGVAKLTITGEVTQDVP